MHTHAAEPSRTDQQNRQVPAAGRGSTSRCSSSPAPSAYGESGQAMKPVCHAGSWLRRQMQKVVSSIENAGSWRHAANSVGTVPVPTSDHRLVWIDAAIPGN